MAVGGISGLLFVFFAAIHQPVEPSLLPMWWGCWAASPPCVVGMHDMGTYSSFQGG